MNREHLRWHPGDDPLKPMPMPMTRQEIAELVARSKANTERAIIARIQTRGGTLLRFRYA